MCLCVLAVFQPTRCKSPHTQKLAWAQNNIAHVKADQQGSGEGGATALAAATRAAEPNVRNGLGVWTSSSHLTSISSAANERPRWWGDVGYLSRWPVAPANFPSREERTHLPARLSASVWKERDNRGALRGANRREERGGIMATLLGAAWQAVKEQDFSLFNPRTKLAGLGCRDGFPANNKAAP